jgi:hypothetical protein
MPITYKVVDYAGDEFGQISYFNEQVDLDMLRSPSAKAKIDATLKRNRYNIDFIVTIPKISRMGNLIATRNYLKKRFGEDYIQSDRITVVYQHNTTTKENHVPMTSWILAHRMAHLTMLPNNVTSSGMWTALYEKLLPLFGENLIPDLREVSSRELDWGMEAPAFYVMSYLLTMRSARMGRITLSPDYFAEMLAQHIINGKTKFLRAKHWQERIDFLRNINFESVKKNGSHISILRTAPIVESALSRMSHSEIDMLLEQAEQVVNLELEKFMASCMGKTMVF